MIGGGVLAGGGGGAGLLGHAHVGARVRGPEVREGPGVGVAAVGRARRAGSGVRENPNPRATKAQLLPSARLECQTGSSTTTTLGRLRGTRKGGDGTLRPEDVPLRQRPTPGTVELRPRIRNTFSLPEALSSGEVAPEERARIPRVGPQQKRPIAPPLGGVDMCVPTPAPRGLPGRGAGQHSHAEPRLRPGAPPPSPGPPALLPQEGWGPPTQPGNTSRAVLGRGTDGPRGAQVERGGPPGEVLQATG